MSSTRARIVTAALSAITIVVLDAGIAHASSGLKVSLTVDGQSRQVTTTAATVGGLLADQNVSCRLPRRRQPRQDLDPHRR